MVAVAYRSAIYSSSAAKARVSAKTNPSRTFSPTPLKSATGRSAVSQRAKIQLKRAPKKQYRIFEFVKKALVQTTIVAIIAGTFFLLFYFNVAASTSSIQQRQLERAISVDRQDIQSTRLSIENKGTTIPQQAIKLGMVPRGDTIMVEIEGKATQIDESKAAITAVQKSYEQTRK